MTAQTVTVELSVEQFLVSDITSDSVRLSWIVPYGDFDSFLVRYTDADGTPQALPVEGGSRTLRVPNLKPSQRYQFDLYGVVDGKLLGPLSVNAVTGQQGPVELTSSGHNSFPSLFTALFFFTAQMQ